MSSDGDGLRAPLRDAVYSPVEALWGGGLSAAARFTPARHRCWHGRGSDRVVVVAPHPDDETIGAGGAIALHLEAGDDVTVAVVTDGSASRALPIAAEAMAAARVREVSEAVQTLGGPSLVLLGLRERGWDEPSASVLLQPLIDAATIVYAPSRIDFHPDHLLAARVIASLVSPGQVVRIMELGVPLTSRLVNLVADVSRVRSAKERALAAFASQRGTLLMLARLARYRARRYGLGAVEVFWELDGGAYARLMTEGTGTRNENAFRGVRVRPFLDPLCWLAGRSERARLLRVATQ